MSGFRFVRLGIRWTYSIGSWFRIRSSGWEVYEGGRRKGARFRTLREARAYADRRWCLQAVRHHVIAWCGPRLSAGRSRESQTMRMRITSLLVLLAVAGLAPAEMKHKATRFRLQNGLTVLVRPVRGANDVALVVLYPVGGDHDPEGRSGLGHLIEHVYATAAVGTQKARTFEEVVQRYPRGWNFQTGDRYTVIATVFPKKDLPKELRDAAARMGDLRVAETDLERERPRIRDELENMFGGIPWLAAQNHARERARPTPLKGRKGGLMEHVQAISLKEVRDRWKSSYKPANAVLVLAGAVEEEVAREAVKEHFAGLPADRPAPRPHDPGKGHSGKVHTIKVRTRIPQAGPEVCLAFVVPDPGSDLHAPFLMLAARLQARQDRLAAGPGRFPVAYRALDDPSVLHVAAPAKKGETPGQAVARLRSFVDDALKPELSADDLTLAREAFGLPFGLADYPDFVHANNVYGLAFSLGRREQMGIDPGRLGRTLRAVTKEQLRRAAREVFSPDRQAAVFVEPRKP